MIKPQEYLARRNALAAKLPEGAIAIFPAARELIRNGDAHYRFRQDSDFYYLTGFNEPNALLLISAEQTPKSYLFNQSRNPQEEQWSGKRLGQPLACEKLKMDEAFPIESLALRLPELMANKTVIYYSLGRYPFMEKEVLKALKKVKEQIRKGVKAPEALADPYPLLSEMRLFKSEAELALMRKAASISVAAHKRAMQACSKLENEYQLEAELLYEFARLGCRSVAYDSIVGGGKNACILHYTANNQPLHKGDLVLIDAAGEYENYAADVTRTYPINGRFSPEQRAIYDLVLNAQKAGIACIKPGVLWNKVQETIIHILTAGLVDLGILKGSVDSLIEKEAYKPFYMHNSGHWLGLDVHDAGRYKIEGQWRVFKAGMVLTVEPGLYISEGLESVDSRWWNIGVRIEDDILVTAEGHENLTSSLPVDADDIEALICG